MSGIRVESDKQNLKRRRLWRYGPLVIWAGLIFIGSSQLLSGSNTSPVLLNALRRLLSGVSDATLLGIIFTIRKLGHFAEYAVLAWLAARAFRTSSREFIKQHWFGMSLALVVVYSISDEFHQSFVPSRRASILDSIIDSAGGLTALTIIWARQRRKSKRAKLRSSVAA